MRIRAPICNLARLMRFKVAFSNMLYEERSVAHSAFRLTSMEPHKKDSNLCKPTFWGSLSTKPKKPRPEAEAAAEPIDGADLTK